MVGPVGVPLTSPTPDAGQAATQFGSVGFYVHVDAVVGSTEHVAIRMTFRNTSTQQQRVDVADFQLQAANGAAVRATPGDGCQSAGRVDLYAPGMPSSTPLRDRDGQRVGPTYRTAICFPAPGPKPWTLIWEPDVAFGPLSEPIRIPLR